MPSLISCIIPVFNGERYLGEAIETIFAQTFRPLEVIVADDGSTDGSAAVAASYGEQVVYLRQAHAGPAAARNLGLSVARGEFIAFLDADDLWHSEKLARQVGRYAARPELDLCILSVQNFWSPELQDQVPGFAAHPLAKPYPGYGASALCARKSFFSRIGGFNPALYHADVKDWFLRAAEHGAVIEVLPDILVYRRLHRTNMSHHKAAVSREDSLQIVKASLDRRRAGGTASCVSPLSLPNGDEGK